jgi:hypothetical protein
MKIIKIAFFACFLQIFPLFYVLAQVSNLDALKNKVSKMTLNDTLAIKQIEIRMGQEWTKLSDIDANEESRNT